MTTTELIAQAREYAEWAEANIYEVPITLPDVLKQMADMLEADKYALKPGRTYAIKYPEWAGPEFVSSYMRNIQPDLDVTLIPLFGGIDLVQVNEEEAK